MEALPISRVWQQVIWRTSVQMLALVIFVKRKKGSKTKKRMKEEEIEKGDCGPPNSESLFLRFCRTWTKRYLITLQTRVKRVSRIHHRTILTRLTLVCEVIRYRLVQVRQNLKKRLALVPFFENWKRFSLTVWMFLISFPYRLALSHCHGLFFRYLTWSDSFFLLWLSIWQGAHSCLETSWENSETKSLVIKDFFVFCPVSIVFCRGIRISLIMIFTGEDYEKLSLKKSCQCWMHEHVQLFRDQ